MKRRLMFLLFIAFVLCGCSNKKQKEQLAEDFSNETDFNLACMISDGKYEKAGDFIDLHPEIITRSFSTEPYYSVLHEAVYENKPAAVELLLKKGFNPNVKSFVCSPLALDCQINENKKSLKDYENSSIMKLLLDYGADANVGEYGSYFIDKKDKRNGQPEMTPLMLLSFYPDHIDVIEKINLLVNECHVDVNYQTSTGYTAVAASLEPRLSIKNAFYLICKLHADVNTVFYDNLYYYEKKENPKTPVMLLRNHIFPLDSDEYQMKLQIIKEFEAQGVDYYSEPVSEEIMNAIKLLYPDSWEEYLKVY